MQSDIYGDMVKIETGNRIPVWRTAVFPAGNSDNSDVDWAITTKFGLLIDIDLLKRGTSASLKPEVKLRLSGRQHHNSTKDGPIWVEFDAEWHAKY